MLFAFQSALLSVSLLGALVNVGVIAQSIACPIYRVWPVPADRGRFKGLRIFLNRAAAPIIGLSVASIDLPQFVVPVSKLMHPTVSHSAARLAIAPCRVPADGNPGSCQGRRCCTRNASAR